MDLSEEQKRRIIEEEQQRLAEEQFRMQARRELRTQANGSQKSKITKPLILALAAVVVLLCAWIFASGRFSHSVPSSTPVSGTGTTTDSTPASTAIKPSPTSPPPPQKLTTAQIAGRATPSVVVVENFNEDGEKAQQGSGYVFSGDGIVITNYHVIRGAKSLNVKVPGREPYRVDSILGYEIDHDVAAVQVSGASLPALSTETIEEPKVGDRVVAIGAPLGLESTVSEGIVSAIRDAGTIHIIQRTASISPGSSGGPLLNDYGRVVGLTTSTVLNGQSINFVVSVRHVSELLSRKQPMSLEEMLTQTHVTDQLPASTIPVPARNAMQLPFTVRGQQAAILEGTYTITGGFGRDVGVMLVGSGGVMILNSGRVSGTGQIKRRLPRGSYAIIFDNRFSNFTAKSVSPDLKLSYYR